MAETTGAQVRQWLEERAITSVRIEATNLDGTFVGKSISPKKFLSGLETGFPFADVVFGNDLGNFPQFGFAFPQWRGDLLDIFLRPDLGTLIEWAPGKASVIGDFWTKTGDPVSVCPRNLLRKVERQAAVEGYSVRAAIEIEATLFEESVHEARRKGYKDLTPLGGVAGGAYVHAKSGDWWQFLDRVQQRLEELGLEWEACNDEAAVGQIEVNVAVADIVTTADNWARTRQVLREVANELGRSVTFMAKWSDAWGQASHLNISLANEDGNAFFADDGPSDVMRNFIGGVMQTLPGATSLALPFMTSYRRQIPLEGPPTTVTWGIDNKTTAVRAVTRHPQYSRIEYRTPGADSNAYLVAAAVLGAGLYGVVNGVEPPAPFVGMAWCNPAGTEALPHTITRAADALAADKALVEVLGQEFVDYWIGTRRWEWLAFHTMGGVDPDCGITDWELNRYFELV
jgi:glutamine synthetase